MSRSHGPFFELTREPDMEITLVAMASAVAGYVVGYINGFVEGRKDQKKQALAILRELEDDADRSVRYHHSDIKEWTLAEGACNGVRMAIAALRQEHWLIKCQTMDEIRAVTNKKHGPGAVTQPRGDFPSSAEHGYDETGR